MASQTLKFADYSFHHGLNKDVPSAQMTEDELAEAMNAVLMPRGGVKKRLGTEPINSIPYNGIVEQLIEWQRKDGTITLLAIIGSELCSLDDINNPESIISLTGDKFPRFFLQDKLYFIDNNEFYVYDGNDVKIVRPYIYLANTEGTFQIGETITGSDSEATAVIDIVENNSLGVSNVIGAFETTETITGGTSGSTASIESLDSGVDERNNLDPIKKCKFAIYHPKSYRVFFSGNPDDISAIYFSDYNNPSFVLETNKVYPTTGEGAVKGLDILMDALIVGYRYGNWIWRGVDPTSDAIWEKLPTSYGPINNEATALTTNSFTMVSDNGIFAMSPSIIGVPMDSEVGSSYIRNIARDKVISILNKATNPETITTVFDNRNSRFMISYCDDSTGRNNKVLALDWEMQAFSEWDNVNINDFCRRLNGDILAATENYILKLNSGTSDIAPDGTEKVFNFTIKTPKYNFGHPFYNKKISRIYIVFKNYGEIHQLETDLIVDDELVYQFSINGTESNKDIITHREKCTFVGNNFQLVIRNTQYSDAEIYGIGFDWTPVRPGGDRL